MAIKKELVFITSNRPGALGFITTALAQGGVDLLAVDSAGGLEYNVVRIVPDSTARAKKILQHHGHAVTESDILLITTKDRPGALAKIANTFGKAAININYLYATGSKMAGETTVVVRVANPDAAQKALGRL